MKIGFSDDAARYTSYVMVGSMGLTLVGVMLYFASRDFGWLPVVGACLFLGSPAIIGFIVGTLKS